MKPENLTEEVIEKIEEVNKQIDEINAQFRELHARVKSDYEDLIKEIEYRRSLGEDI